MTTPWFVHGARAALAASFITFASPSFAGAVQYAGEFIDFTLAAGDDSSAGPVNIGFAVNINGTTRTQAFVNNNGNITFDQAFSGYTPFSLIGSSFPIIAPFFADVDTRAAGSGLTQYGTGTINGRAVFGVNWLHVGYFNQNDDKVNDFQLILTDRSDTGAGNFDIQFNYDRIQWETGAVNGGVNGLGGVSAAVGYSTGPGGPDYEFAGSRVNGAFLDTNATGLIFGSLNSATAGEYNFQVRNGVIQGGSVPEPGGLALVGLALFGVGVARRTLRR